MCLAVIQDFSRVTFEGVFKVSTVWEVAVALPLKTGGRLSGCLQSVLRELTELILTKASHFHFPESSHLLVSCSLFLSNPSVQSLLNI